MSGIILRWLGGGGGDTLCQILLKNNSDTYFNFNEDYVNDATGRTLLDIRPSVNYPSISRLFTGPIKNDKEKLKEEFVRLIKNKEKFIVKTHYFDQEFDEFMRSHLPISDIGFNLEFLPYMVQANVLKNEMNYPAGLNHDYFLKQIGQKLNEHQKKQVMIWIFSKSAIRHLNEFSLDKASFRTQDLFYNNDRVENFFKEKGYNIDLNTSFFSKWKNNSAKYLPSKKYQSCLENKNYDYNNQKELSIVERYIFLSLAGQNFTFLD